MCQILAKVPLSDVPAETVQKIIQLAFAQSNQAITVAQHEYIICDSALTYVGCLARAILKLKAQ